MQIVYGVDVPSTLVKMIDQAQKNVILVSPYLDPWGHLTTAVKRAKVARGCEVVLVVRGGRDAKKQLDNATPWKEFGVKVHQLERLHAKVYFTERYAMVTSMNLLKSSAEASWECAMLFDRTTDEAGFNQVASVVTALGKQVSDEAKLRAHDAGMGASSGPRAGSNAALVAALNEMHAKEEAIKEKKKSKRGAVVSKPEREEGFCIRCGVEVDHSLDKPYCKKHWKSWARFKNEDYPEAHCHTCGEEHDASMKRPQCLSCWRASR